MFKKALLFLLFVGISVCSLMANVSYLDTKPKIDGVASEDLPHFQLQEFGKIGLEELSQF